jgi:S-DNA-T family DNA segregation ATPase FtsK/SpoIIIE
VSPHDQTIIRSGGGGGDAGRLPRDKRVVLVVIGGPAMGAEREVDRVPFTLGRQGADFTVADQSVSRLHAMLTVEGGRFVLRDQKSTNGTFVDGERIEETTLTHGSKFRLGDTTVQFVLEPRKGGR